MNLPQYEREGHQAYASLADAMAKILAVVVHELPELRVQQIQNRAKDPASLRNKLDDRRMLNSEDIEAEIKDLAGCRIILYTNADVRRLLSSGAIRDNFDVDWDRTKFHYPTGEDAAADELFISYNYVLKLKEQRTALPEYARFRDKWCEVQVQTTLDHAWSEMAHDTVYKRRGIGFGTSVVKDIEKRMANIARQYLRPAGFDFQKVADDVRRLSVGRHLFEADPIKTLSLCKSNNERHDFLVDFLEYVLPYYDDLPAAAPSLREALVAAVSAARKAETVPNEFGLDGYDVESVVELAFDAFDSLRFVHPGAIEATFDSICSLFPGSAPGNERKRILGSAERLTKHNLNAWRSVGPLVQETLVSKIGQLTSAAAKPLREVLVEILKQVLLPDVRGTSSDYRTLTIHTGAVRASASLTQIRADALSELENLFLSSETDSERRAVANAVGSATQLPNQGTLDAELMFLVISDTLRIVRFYLSIVEGQGYEIQQELEHDIFWLYRRFSKLPPAFEASPEILHKRDELISAIFAFRDLVNADRSFVVYKTLVGFRSIFSPAWLQDNFDLRAERDYRNSQITKLVENIREDNIADWFVVIRRCAQPTSVNGATFQSFQRFLEEFGKSKPDIFFELLGALDDELARFLPAMLRGIENGPRDSDMRSLIRDWVRSRRYLEPIAHYCEIASKLDADILSETFAAALLESDERAIRNLVDAATRRYADTNAPVAKTVFLSGLEFLAARHDFTWVNSLGAFAQDESILTTIGEAGLQEILGCLVGCPRIGHSEEEILSALAMSIPLKVVDFFGDRLRLARQSSAPPHYEAVPFHFGELGERLAPLAGDVVQTVHGWFDEDDELFEFRGAAFLAHVFPNFTPLSQPFLTLVSEGDRRKIEFVLDVLRSYEGQSFLHEICIEIVAVLPDDDPLLEEVSIILGSTGVVTGEFGFVAASQRQKAEMAGWLSDPRQRVSAFVNRFVRSLDRKIAAEQRRGMESLELRKRQYGEKDSGASDDSE